MKTAMSKIFLSGVLLASLIGCAEVIKEREGAELQIVPITNSYHLTIKAKKDQQAWLQLQDYIEQHWDVLSVEEITIDWFSRRGKTLAMKLADKLQKEGISADMIHINQAKSERSDHFDLSLHTTKYKVVANVCDYPKVGEFGAYPEGCYAESARWQSMVHPEKMLLTSEKDK
ncbi:putative lipoprotein [Vibrio ichthyoenteri ATCC 700023]|uniref:Putative lipoprotein n=1 Tax=Vibrio ichthyoenteri ATCC 700023 TaxID=870968 RepID=F9RWY3_9VIBR|nr:hypothetical protein [Vibrio ichthyoenteri]EGU48897.1 putative lipoprotein [Vibrio ichthyoenteri ATCC 700023]